ncbi:kinase-like protein [Rhizophagus irregularis]|uniref:Kinase-like protein n=1 Tax=Rhizophagus irregularis TaxID=588596 RepID=A0A2N0P7C6_9GLOM|nr:kinase-like protein [Rhizophagus irregularis]
MRWNRFELFTNFIYHNEKPDTTSQEVLDIYNQNLIDIITIKNINYDIVNHVRKIHEQKNLKTIGDSLLDIRRSRAKKRVNITDDTREDFQNVRINDRMNQKSDVYADWSSEESQDRIYDDLETSDLPSKADNEVEPISSETSTANSQTVDIINESMIELEKRANETIKRLLQSKDLEEIWKLVMDRMSEKNIKVQAIELRIIDLTNWSSLEWSRILKTEDKAKLFRTCWQKLLKDQIDETVIHLIDKTSLLKDKLSNIGSEDEVAMIIVPKTMLAAESLLGPFIKNLLGFRFKHRAVHFYYPNMEEFILSDDVFEKLKKFNHEYQTKEQSLLIDKLILNEELKKRYKSYGLCEECKQPNTGETWCKSCNSKHLQQNFKNWTSGNNKVDKFIQKTQLEGKSYRDILEWIEYDRFKNVKYLAKGGFGTIYKSIWKDGYMKEWDSGNNKWMRRKKSAKDYENFPVALKCLHNSQNITAEFLREIELHIVTSSVGGYVNRCYGITKDPESNNFMMVMEYAENGSLRQILNNSFNSMYWIKKLDILRRIANGLEDIHSQGLIHHDFHCGNILNGDYNFTFITDLGLCRPANVIPSQDEYKKMYGVLPYVAPEVLIGKEYTQESDIYGFGIIAYEVCTGLPPYHDIAHDKILAISISVYTSRLLDFKNLPEPKNAIDSKDNDSFEYSESIEAIDFTNST